MPEPTNLVADTICRTVELGLTITGAAVNETITRIDCRPVEYDPTCPNCGQPGRLRDHVERTLTDLPVVGLNRLGFDAASFLVKDADHAQALPTRAA